MKKNITILRQLLQPISRYEFQKAMQTYKVEKHAKGLSSWNQFTAMVFGQISNQRSLKNIESGLRTNTNKLYHLGISKTSKSTLAYANENRDYRAYKELFYLILEKIQRFAPKHKFQFKNKLTSLDATTIDLCKTQFPWANFRKSKSGIKLVVKLNHNGYLPEYVQSKNAIKHEMHSVNQIPFDEKEIIAFDRGFSDYQFFATLYKKGSYFVTRLKKNALYEVIKDVKQNFPNILSEKIISFKGYYSKKKCPMSLRKIMSKDPETGKVIVIITNNFKLSAEVISAIYRERWQIEIFFKTMKQFLRIKKYYGNSKNAVLTQIFIALIVFLLLKYLKFTSKIKISFSQMMAMLTVNLFHGVEIYELFDRVNKPPPSPKSEKLLQEVLF